MKREEGILILICALMTIFGCGEKIKPGDHTIERQEVTGVVIEEVRSVDSMDYYETSGTVKAANTSLVSAKIMGEVRDIKVAAGDRVRKGDLLLVIHSPDVESRAAAAREALGEARKGMEITGEKKDLMLTTYERYRRLHEEKAVTEQEFDEVKAKKDIAGLQYEQALKSLKKAEAALQEAEAFMDYTAIRSPVDGIVAERKVDRGSMTVPAMTLFVIEEALYRVEVPVDEGLLPLIRLTMPVDIFIHSLNVQREGTVGEIVHHIDPRSRTFTVKIDMTGEQGVFRGGLYAQVKFPVGPKAALFIPESALVTRGELKGVYVVDGDDVVTFRLVRTGKTEEGMTAILSGLQQGERIIVKGTERAIDGGRVRKG
jgi:RND family efflux transporter MFP subunit